MGFTRFILVLVLALSFATSCGKSSEDEEGNYDNTPTSTQSTGTTVTFRWLVANVFQPKCSSCHDFSLYSEVLPKVVKGNPSNSRLYYMVSTGRMPQTGSKLSKTQLQAIWSWIQQGARNN